MDDELKDEERKPVYELLQDEKYRNVMLLALLKSIEKFFKMPESEKLKEIFASSIIEELKDTDFFDELKKKSK